MRLDRSLLSLANGEAYEREVAFQCSSYAALIRQLKDRGDVFAYSSQPSVVLPHQVVLVLVKRGKFVRALGFSVIPTSTPETFICSRHWLAN